MKTNKINYMNTDNSLDWYIWNVFCDICGRQFRNHKIHSSVKPDENEKDYCLDCMREMIDNKFNNKEEI